MEKDKWQHYLSEDILTIPVMMKELSMKDVQADPSCCLPLQERCEVCYRQGTGKPVHGKYEKLQDRRKSFPEGILNEAYSLHLAETGLFWSEKQQLPDGNRKLTCFYCGQDIHLVDGENALQKHADVFRNCRHVCKILGHPNRRPRSGTEMMSCPSSPLINSRRRFASM